MGRLRKLLTILCAGLIVLVPAAPLFGVAGQWNGVAATAINGVAQTAWNGTGVSSAAGGGGGTVTFDATAKGSQAGGGGQTTCTVAITIGTLTDGCLTVHAALGAVSTTTFTGVTYNGVAMTQIGTTQTVGGSGSGKTSAWRLVNPASGTHNIVATVNVPLASATEVIMVEGSSWSFVNQTTPVSGVAQGPGASNAPSVTVISGTGNRVIAGANGGDSFTAWAATDRNHQNVNTGTGGGNSALSDRAGTASEVMTWGLAGSDSWAAIGFSLDHD